MFMPHDCKYNMYKLTNMFAIIVIAKKLSGGTIST